MPAKQLKGDPERAGAGPLGQPVRFADITRPHTAAEPKSCGIAAADNIVPNLYDLLPEY
jgi:hypothetical protein